MKLPVPFFKQTTKSNCGPAALRMILAYLDKDPGIEILDEQIGIKEGKGVLTIQLATAAASLGFKTKFFSKNLGIDPTNFESDFYKKYAEEDLQNQVEKLINKAKQTRVELDERSIPQEELLSFVTENSLPIVLIDWNIIKNRKGYHGHFAPVVGYDKENVYIHNHGLKDTQEFMPIKKDLFDKARKAQGTDEDVVVVYRKSD